MGGGIGMVKTCKLKNNNNNKKKEIQFLKLKKKNLKKIKKGIITLLHLERHTEFNASKGDDALLFLKVDRNPNITVPTRK